MSLDDLGRLRSYRSNPDGALDDVMK